MLWNAQNLWHTKASIRSICLDQFHLKGTSLITAREIQSVFEKMLFWQKYCLLTSWALAYVQKDMQCRQGWLQPERDKKACFVKHSLNLPELGENTARHNILSECFASELNYDLSFWKSHWDMDDFVQRFVLFPLLVAALKKWGTTCIVNSDLFWTHDDLFATTAYSLEAIQEQAASARADITVCCWAECRSSTEKPLTLWVSPHVIQLQLERLKTSGAMPFAQAPSVYHRVSSTE